MMVIIDHVFLFVVFIMMVIIDDFFLFVIFIMMVIIDDVFFYGKIMRCRDLVSRGFKYRSRIIYVVGYMCLFMEL
jgi:hypothetical protein